MKNKVRYCLLALSVLCFASLFGGCTAPAEDGSCCPPVEDDEGQE